MKKLAIAVTTIAAFTAPALAADIAVKAPRAAAPVAYAPSWTGCYINGGGGYGLFSADHDQVVTGPPNGGGTTFPVGTLSAANETAGGRGSLGIVGGGCDYQFGGGGFWGNLVIGAFGDYMWSDIKGDTDTFAHNFNDGSAVGSVGSLKQSSAWAAGGRVGWVVVPQLLTYFTGGYTEAKFDGVDFTTKLAQTGLGGVGTVTGLNLPSQTYHGWFIGGGTEYALGWIPGLFLKSEYRYSTYDSKTIGTNCVGVSAPGPATSCATVGPSGFADRYTPHVQTVFTELVYRFNWGGPVAPRY